MKFQFLMVRLKEVYWKKVSIFAKKISIPYGAIKRKAK